MYTHINRDIQWQESLALKSALAAGVLLRRSPLSAAPYGQPRPCIYIYIYHVYHDDYHYYCDYYYIGCMHVYTYIYLYIHMYICMYVCVHVNIYIYIYI